MSTCVRDLVPRLDLALEPGAACTCSHIQVITQTLQWAPRGTDLQVLHATRACETLSEGQTWPQSQVLPIHNHTDHAVGHEWLRLARYCMIDVWVRTCLMVRPGLRARCCLYIITQTLQWAPNGSDLLGTAWLMCG